MHCLSLYDRTAARDIVLWAIDHGVADGNPWIIRLALVFGEDLGYCIRVWRKTGTNNYSEAFVNLTHDISRNNLWKVWAVNLKSHRPMKVESYDPLDMLLDSL